MPPLDAPPTPPALANLHTKRADDRPLHRQLFLILGRHAQAAHGALTMRTLRGERRLVGLVDVRGRTAMRVRAMRRAGLSARATRSRDARPAGEGRGLPRDCASRSVELLFQVFVFPPQALTLRFRAPEVLA